MPVVNTGGGTGLGSASAGYVQQPLPVPAWSGGGGRPAPAPPPVLPIKTCRKSTKPTSPASPFFETLPHATKTPAQVAVGCARPVSLVLPLPRPRQRSREGVAGVPLLPARPFPSRLRRQRASVLTSPAERGAPSLNPASANAAEGCGGRRSRKWYKKQKMTKPIRKIRKASKKPKQKVPPAGVAQTLVHSLLAPPKKKATPRGALPHVSARQPFGAFLLPPPVSRDALLTACRIFLAFPLGVPQHNTPTRFQPSRFAFRSCLPFLRRFLLLSHQVNKPTGHEPLTHSTPHHKTIPDSPLSSSCISSGPPPPEAPPQP